MTSCKLPSDLVASQNRQSRNPGFYIDVAHRNRIGVGIVRLIFKLRFRNLVLSQTSRIGHVTSDVMI